MSHKIRIKKISLPLQPRSKRNACLFCSTIFNNNSNQKSSEHVFPGWLLSLLSIKNSPVEPTHLSSVTLKPISKRKHILDSLREGRVCKKCNTGWMSVLEARSKKILTPLIVGSKTIEDLTRSERFQVALWAAKTAFVLNSSSNFHQNVPDEHFKFIKNKKLPNNVWVFAQQHDNSEKFYWMQQPAWPMYGNKHNLEKVDLEKITKNFYKIVLQFGKLLLLICYIPNKKWAPTIWSGVHIPMWPLKGKLAISMKPSTIFPWNDTKSAVVIFSISLELINTDLEV